MNTEQNIAMITTGYLNTVNDALPGQPVSSGTGDPQYLGQLGAKLAFTHSAAADRSSTYTLYGGRYQYVLSKAASSASPARGKVAYWYDESTFVVTPDYPTGSSRIAGIYLNAVSKGYYGWIQVSGLATVLFQASITKTTPAIGDLVLATAGDCTADVLADGTSITSVQLRSVLGVAAEAPTGGGYKLVELWERFRNT